MPGMTLAIFDPNITDRSPAGSCLLKMLRRASCSYQLELFTTQTDVEPEEGIRIHYLPVPLKPVFLQSILFTITSIIAVTLIPGKRLRLGTQGGFPLCDISYAHCCHRLFLTQYRDHISGGLFTRAARFMNHYWSAAMETMAFKRAKLIVVPSAGLAKELTQAYGPVVATKLRIIPNPVGCEKFAPKEWDPSPRPFTFAFCALGNFEWKGLRLIIESLANCIPAQLTVIGGSNAEIERYRKLSDRVSFVGTQNDIRPYLWNSDVFVFPSVYETFPLVCLQAAAAGLPLITTNLYGLEELLQPGVSGWRVERTVEAITAAMRAAMADPRRTSEMGLNAKVLARKYDEAAFQQRWLEVLAQEIG